MKLGETSEVWLLGEDIIKRGGCKDFSLYDKRKAPKETSAFYFDNKLYMWENGMMQEYKAVGKPKKDEILISYEDEQK